MSGECNRCGEHCLDCNCPCLSKCILKRLEDIGCAREKLQSIIDEDIFENLSKHNPYWDSEHEKESEKLYDIRIKLAYFKEKLWEIYSTLSQENHD